MSDLSEILPEPLDGLRVVLTDAWRDSAPMLIWRDDVEAALRGGLEGERWFNESTWHDGDPFDWAEITKGSTSATIVPATPTAQVTP